MLGLTLSKAICAVSKGQRDHHFTASRHKISQEQKHQGSIRHSAVHSNTHLLSTQLRVTVTVILLSAESTKRTKTISEGFIHQWRNKVLWEYRVEGDLFCWGYERQRHRGGDVCAESWGLHAEPLQMEKWTAAHSGEVSVGCVLRTEFSGSCNKVLGTRWLQQQEFIVSRFWRPEDLGQGVGRAGPFWGLWGRIRSRPLSQVLVICRLLAFLGS